jgi:histidine triad (HIT) family protein
MGSVVHEDDVCAVLLHPDSAVAGHAMVVAKRHVENIADLDDREREHFIRIHAAAERVLLDMTRTDRAILVKLGIAVPHLHLHIYPVSRRLDRKSVQRIIDAEVREQRHPHLVDEVRLGLWRLLNQS